MSYDAWKTRSPDDDRFHRLPWRDDEPDDDYPFYDPAEDCDHDDYESDILIGRATCNMCGHTWWQTPEEIEAEHQRIADYDRHMRKVGHREKWSRLIAWLRSIFRRPKPSTDTDDELPF